MQTEVFVLIELSRADRKRLKQKALFDGEDWLVQWEFLSRLVYTAMLLDRGEVVSQTYARFIDFLEHGRKTYNLSYRESAVLAFYSWLDMDLTLHEIRVRISEFPLFLVGESGTRYEF
jgi:hypothetical protein